MKLSILLITLFFPLILFSKNILDGIYRGVEPKYSTNNNGKRTVWRDEENPRRKWFSLISIKFKGDSLFWDDIPVTIYKKDTLYSSSDGGFFYYTGTFKKTDSVLNLDLKELFCDYCGIPHKKDSNGKSVIVIRKKLYSARIVKDGILINGNLFKKLDENYHLQSEGPVPDFWK